MKPWKIRGLMWFGISSLVIGGLSCHRIAPIYYRVDQITAHDLLIDPVLSTRPVLPMPDAEDGQALRLEDGQALRLEDVLQNEHLRFMQWHQTHEKWKFFDPPLIQGWTLNSYFLHFSDAQIRDDRAYDPRVLDKWDKIPFLKNTRRATFIEQIDHLILATFLHAFQQSPDLGVPRFAIHTGDLLDISLVTEFIEAQNVLRMIAPSLPVYLVPGNHDGLLWGVLRDDETRTWEIALNRKEFVLASLLSAPKFPADSARRGYGFAKNELVKELFTAQCCAASRLGNSPSGSTAKTCNSQNISENIPESREALCRLRFLRSLPPQELIPSLTSPLFVKRSVNIDDREDQHYQFGYYSFDVGSLRYVVLDTNARFPDEKFPRFHSGDLDDVQFGWLYLTLLKSYKQGRPVVVLGHHAPAHFWEQAKRATLEKMLTQFPNVIAYLYGHAHAIKVSQLKHLPMIQAPSLVDYPRAAALFYVFTRQSVGGAVQQRQTEFLLRLLFVQPRIDFEGKALSSEDLILDAALYEADVFAFHDPNKGTKDKGLKFGQIKVPEKYAKTARGSHRMIFDKASGATEIHYAIPRDGWPEDASPAAEQIFGSQERVEEINKKRQEIDLPLMTQ